MPSSKPPGIVVYCRNCGKKNRAPATAAGKDGACAQCGQLMLIPEESEAGPPERPKPQPASCAPPTPRPEPKPAAQPDPKPASPTEERPQPTAQPAAEEKPLPVAFEPPSVVATPVAVAGEEDLPFDGSLPELDAILKDLDDLPPSPGEQRAGGSTKPKCPACGTVLNRAADACVRCGWRPPKQQ